MFGAYCESRPNAIPYGIYTIPEISIVGKTEQELTAEKVPYEIGVSKFEELAKGQMLGVDTGLLKILFDRKTRKLLGVHIFGERATEIIHIGQAVSPSAARSTTSATPSSTTRPWPRPTRSPASTA